MEQKLLNNINLQKIFLGIKEEFKERESEIYEISKIDYKYCKMDFSISNLLLLIDSFKSERTDNAVSGNFIIKYNGDPYITLNLCLLAISMDIKIVLDFEEVMLLTNKTMLEIINAKLKSVGIKEKISIAKENKEAEQSYATKIICIDDINEYNSYIRRKFKNVEFYSYNYLDFYCDKDDFNDLEETIYRYAELNKIPIEVYSELEVQEAVKMISKGLGKKVMLLSKNEETIEIFLKNIKNKKIYINKNPFEDKYNIITKNIFK